MAMNTSLQQTRTEIGSEDTTSTLFKQFAEKMNVRLGPKVVEERITSSDSLWDLALWDSGTFNESYSANQNRIRVDNKDNTFEERFEFDLFVDSGSTMGTYSTTTQSVTLGPNKIFQSKAIFLDTNGTRLLDSATLSTLTSSGTVQVAFSGNGGVSWGTVDSTSTAAFSGSGRGYDLRVRMVNLTATTLVMSKYTASYSLGN